MASKGEQAVHAFRQRHPDGCIDVGTGGDVACAMVMDSEGRVLATAHAFGRHKDNRAMYRALALAGFAALRCDEGEDVCDAPCEPGFRGAVQEMVRKARMNAFGAYMTPEEVHAVSVAMGETDGPE